MAALWTDVRHACLVIRRAPGFTAIAVLSLALAIGVNSAVFSLLNAVVLRNLRVRDPQSLVNVETLRPDGTRGGFSFPVFEDLARQQQAFSAWIGYSGGGVFNVDVNGTLFQGAIWAVTGNFYSELGARPFAGRFLADDDVNLTTRTPSLVAVLGYGVWQRQFGGDQSAIGQAIKVEGVAFTIIGIAPKNFNGLDATTEPDVTIPLTAVPRLTVTGQTDRFTNLKVPWVRTVARLRPGMTLDQVRAHLATLWPSIRADNLPSDYSGKDRENFLAARLDVVSAARGVESFLRTRFTRPLQIVLGVAGLILLIACVNLASLMLSRASARQHEFAVRAALGGSRQRLARQMIIEALLISGIAACGGLLFANWGSRALVAMMTRYYLVPGVLDVSPDRRVLVFTGAIAFVSGLLVSLAPVWWVGGQDPSASLRQAGRTFARTGRTGRALIVVQVVLSLVLLVDASLLVRTLRELRAIDLGFRPEGVAIGKLFARPGGYRDFAPDRYYPTVVDRIANLPGVREATLSLILPFFVPRVSIAPLFTSADEITASTPFAPVGPRFFRTLGVSFVAGRDFEWSDNSTSRRVIIVSRSLAERFFPGDAAVGRHVRASGDPSRQDLEIVGVVGDMRLGDPRDANPIAVYVPLLQEPAIARYGLVLMRVDRGFSVAELRNVVQSFGREYLSLYQPLQYAIDRAILQERVTAILAGFFGLLALVLAAVGLYGLVAYDVTQRSREMGIRLALGAERGEVIRMVTCEALALVIGGLVIGAPIAYVGTRLVASLLFGVAPTDLTTFLAVAACLLAIGAVAGWVPGLRASRLNPIETLRA